MVLLIKSGPGELLSFKKFIIFFSSTKLNLKSKKKGYFPLIHSAKSGTAPSGARLTILISVILLATKWRVWILKEVRILKKFDYVPEFSRSFI